MTATLRLAASPGRRVAPGRLTWSPLFGIEVIRPISGPQLLSIAVSSTRRLLTELAGNYSRALSAEFMRKGASANSLVIAAHAQVPAMALLTSAEAAFPLPEVALGGLPCTVFRCAALPQTGGRFRPI